MSEPSVYGVEARKRRWREFMDMDRPPSHVFMIHYDTDVGNRSWPWPDKKAKRIEWWWRSYERSLARCEWIREDTIPCLDVETGTEIFAKAFGCAVHRADDAMPFALPFVHNAHEAARVSVPT